MEEQKAIGIKEFFLPRIKGYFIFVVTTFIHWIYFYLYVFGIQDVYEHYGANDLWYELSLILVLAFIGYLILEFVIKIKHSHMCGPLLIRILEYVIFTIIAGFTEIINLCMYVVYHQV